MINLTQRSYNEINLEVANRVAKFRKRKKITQKELAKRAGVSFGSVKRFEQTGEISLQFLTKIAIALDAEEEIDRLFSNMPFSSIEEVVDEQG